MRAIDPLWVLATQLYNHYRLPHWPPWQDVPLRLKRKFYQEAHDDAVIAYMARRF